MTVLRQRRASAGSFRLGLLFAISLVAGAVQAASDSRPAPPTARGMPLSRSYSYAEIGDLSPGVQLSLDPLGRLVVVEDGTYFYFDDKNWNEVEVLRDTGTNIRRVLNAPDGTTYYGAPAAWGTVEYATENTIKLHPLRPATAPTWTSNCLFDKIVVGPEGVYFAGTSGVVYWEKATGRNTFFTIPDLVTLFTLHDVGYVTSSSRGMLRIDVTRGTLEPVHPGESYVVFDSVMPWAGDRILGWTSGRGFVQFDGQRLTPWRSGVDDELAQGVSRIVELPAGRIAVLAKGRGLYVLNRDGTCELKLVGGEYAGISDVCPGEPGVLWYAGDEGVTKLLYDSPVTIFDHRLGLSLAWPWVGQYRDRVVIVSNGKLYESLPGSPAEPTRFREVALELPGGAWSAAPTRHGLLIGNYTGAYVLTEDSGIRQVTSGFNANRLVALTDDVCLVIGEEKIAALAWTGEAWKIVSGPIPGAGFPSRIVEVPGFGAWIELGVNRVARVSWRNGRVQCQVFDQFPWKVPVWLNLGRVGRTVVISHGDGSRLYFDEEKEAFVDAPDLDRLLRQTPYRVLRPIETADGAIWMLHARGVYRLIPEGGGYKEDFAQFDIIRETYPAIQLAGGADVWVSSAAGLSRVLPRETAMPPAPLQPVLTSVVDARSKRELFSAFRARDGALRGLPYASNSLNFRFFYGTYRRLRPADYQFRLEGYSNEWSLPVKGSTVSLTSLKEGEYRMTVRLVDGSGPVGEPATFTFSIVPPLYRRWYAYAIYVAVFGAGLLLAARWLLRRAAKRTQELEGLVNERTEELRIALEAGDIGSWRRDLPGGEFRLSDQARRIFGIPADEKLTFESFLARFPADDQSALGIALHVALNDHQDFKLDVRNVWPDRSMHWATLAGRGYYDAAGHPIAMEGVAIDVTDRRRAENDRLTVSKLESTGLLAAGVAHDFNNLLAGVLLNAELALDAPEAEKLKALRFTCAAVRTATDLTRQLITFSTGGLPARRPVHLGDLVQAEALRWQQTTRTRIAVSVDPALPLLAGDEDLLVIAVRNLLANAEEASGAEEAVSVVVAVHETAEREIPTLPAGIYARVSVSDRGRGIAPEVLPKIFDPYFSTKQRGHQKGVGLGLTTALSIAQRHGGTVTVESMPGHGATFHLLLPLVGSEAGPVSEPEVQAASRRLRVLVMDDEAPLRDAIGRTVRGLGHDVETVAGGKVAIEIYVQAANAGRRFDTVLLDMTIPGGLGAEDTLRALRAVDPRVHAIVISGHAQNAAMLRWREYGFAGALVKPFTREMLAAVLASARVEAPADLPVDLAADRRPRARG